MRYAVECGIRFEIIFVTATIAVNLLCAGRQGEANHPLKLVDNRSVRRLVVDGYPNPDLRFTCR
jgi:hypothetical protein